jgi:hypothetical protein
MSHVLDVLLLSLGLLVGLWMLIFGLLGVILSERAGVSRSAGALLGIAFGPIGAAWLIWKARKYVPETGQFTSVQTRTDESDSGLLF